MYYLFSILNLCGAVLCLIGSYTDFFAPHDSWASLGVALVIYGVRFLIVASALITMLLHYLELRRLKYDRQKTPLFAFSMIANLIAIVLIMVPYIDIYFFQ